jgi:hypothetical protein
MSDHILRLIHYLRAASILLSLSTSTKKPNGVYVDLNTRIAYNDFKTRLMNWVG